VKRAAGATLRVALVSAVLVASTRSAAAPPRPRFSELPVASILAGPVAGSAPASIERSESVDGFDVRDAVQPRPSRPFVNRIAAVRGSRIPLVTVSPEPSDACLSSLPMPELSGERARVAAAFPVPVPSFASGASGRMQVSGGVHALRLQRLVQKSDRTDLEITDAWVDPETRGARLQRRVEIPLAGVAKTPLGARVFGFRDERRVWLVIEAPEHGDVVGPIATARSRCGHVLTDLEVGSKGAARSFFIEALTSEKNRDDPRKRVSAFALSASISRASRDPEPIISLTIAPVPRELVRTLSVSFPVQSFNADFARVSAKPNERVTKRR